MGVSHLLDCIENEIGLRLLRWGLGGGAPQAAGDRGGGSLPVAGVWGAAGLQERLVYTHMYIYIYMFGVILGMFGVSSWVVLAMFGWVYRSTLMDLY